MFANLTLIQQKERRFHYKIKSMPKYIYTHMSGAQGETRGLYGQIFYLTFISPLIRTAKKDGSVKFAIEARELNKQVHYNENQMPNFKEMMGTVG